MCTFFLFYIQTSSSNRWGKKQFVLSSRTRAPVWTRRTQQRSHRLNRNRTNLGPVRRESSFQSPWRVKKMMKRNLSPHSFTNTKPKRSRIKRIWKQKLMERTVENQNQPRTQVQIENYNHLVTTRLQTHLNLRLKTAVIGWRRGNLRHLKTHQVSPLNVLQVSFTRIFPDPMKSKLKWRHLVAQFVVKVINLRPP